MSRESEALFVRKVPCVLLCSAFCLGKAPISKILRAMGSTRVENDVEGS